MRLYKIHIVIAILMSGAVSYGQISPGDLSNAHADLEGMSKCTLCHDLGKKVSNAKCLDCHKEIQSLINQKRGYHSNPSVTAKDCFACHSEHHGRKFDMVRFDEKGFNHDLTTYDLEGQHAVIDCRKCHKPDNIQNAELRKRNNTFLGLNKECLSCHDDFHQKTLSGNCASCHDLKAFRPASKFDHNKAKFRLSGKHLAVDCKECHPVITKNVKEFQQFTNIPHNDCIACHKDPHGGRIQGKCAQCHTDRSFTEFIGKGRFDHSITDFSLKGKHASVDCFKCHKPATDPAIVFKVSPAITVNQCASCHRDIHNGKLGKNCVQCHNETSFVSLKTSTRTSFDHSVTDYPLEGKHVGVDCNKCHKGRYTEAINYAACKNCHADYHKGEFAKNGVSPDCAECHSVKQGFDQSSYSLERHQKTKFPLEGGHAATPCFACHVSEGRWSFTKNASSCTECHKNVHEDRFAINGITDCKRCHDTESWFPSKFDHNLTAFPLEGRHAEIECSACHKSGVKNGKTFVEYKIAKFQCIDCHH
ncbi:MAG TPA: cytochrome c3 family protein [Cyclobacteriaceae bacterium]|nr:cytochrome c3 family protein [Cyclobacteriaceae bacterium]